jgi:hypothetical protein
MPSQALADLDGTLERLRGWVGGLVIIEESLSRHPSAGHDRHFATRSQCAMQLEFVGWRFSGSALTFEGRQGGERVLHEIALDCVETLEFVTPEHLAIVERFGPQLERHSSFTFKGSAS